MGNAKVFLADSVIDFACTMGDCEDNCCRNTTWNISVDADTYEKYINIGSEIGRHIVDCIEGSTEIGYKFKEFEHGHCPLLTDEGLCYIHKNLGAEYLCTTCTTYPRIWETLNGKYEYWLSLSCPDVVRCALYRKKKITYTELPFEMDMPVSPAESHEAEKHKVRQFLIEIVQHRKFSIKEKLVYIGLFMRSVSKVSLIDNFEKSVNEIIRQYRSQMKMKGFLDKLITDMGTMHSDNRTNFFKMLASVASASAIPPKKIPDGIKNSEFYKLMAGFYKDIEDETAEKYLVDAFDRLIVPYVNANRYVFENYLAYSLVSTKFLHKSENFAEAFSGFTGEFLTMLVFTAGMFHKNKYLTNDEMVAGIYLFHRRVSHNATLRESLAKAFSNDILNLMLGALGGIN
ncbi:MAG: flagellin lysine-N-methylase [Defluviitaleaceae bacterium]|nr:flagellin lysine-N-methylase [Defluviitaleaceae bacterium]